MKILFNTPAPFCKFNGVPMWIRLWGMKDGALCISGWASDSKEVPDLGLIFAGGFTAWIDAAKMWNAGIEVPDHLMPLANALVEAGQGKFHDK